MKKYLSFFRIRFLHGLQYRTAAVSGMVTQFVWGAMEILLFRAFYQADSSSFPMTFQALSTYVWLQQAFWPSTWLGSGRWSCLIPSPRVM